MLRVTVVSEFVEREFLRICRLIGINSINLVDRGMLGNFKTITYDLDILPEEVIDKRKALMNEITETRLLVALYEHGDWMRVYVMMRSAFK